jgi:hypothetical protein
MDQSVLINSGRQDDLNLELCIINSLKRGLLGCRGLMLLWFL